jgi:hypothetical protein
VSTAIATETVAVQIASTPSYKPIVQKWLSKDASLWGSMVSRTIRSLFRSVRHQRVIAQILSLHRAAFTDAI